MKCPYCKEEKDRSSFYKSGPRCKDCEKVRDYKRRRGFNMHKQCIQKLGGKCVKCGFDDERALQIDHVNGGGQKDMRSFRKYKEKYYHWRAYYRHVLTDDTGKFQVLCANCNSIKRHENKEGVR